MGRSARPRPHKVVDQGDISANITSEVTDVENRDRFLYTIDWGGGAGVSGELITEYTNDDPTKAATLWKTLDFGQQILVSTNSGNHQVLVQSVTFKYVRMRYVFTAGTGTIDIVIKSAAEAV